uniref:Uncharacterized protein n=1 Tax=viral metagenome TaxID=1070528 RepID=A0A6M3L1D2_9ZZZZ
MSLPDPVRTVIQIKRMIANNERPVTLLYQFLNSRSTTANLVANTIVSNREAIKVLTSPAGRKWVKYWLDDFLTYLQQMAEGK